MVLFLVGLMVFVLNIPFGYWRSNVKKFSWQWVLSIHIPVPIIIGLRIYSGIGFGWYTYLVLVGAFFFGQKIGNILYLKILTQYHQVSSCLVMDLFEQVF